MSGYIVKSELRTIHYISMMYCIFFGTKTDCCTCLNCVTDISKRIHFRELSNLNLPKSLVINISLTKLNTYITIYNTGSFNTDSWTLISRAIPKYLDPTNDCGKPWGYSSRFNHSHEPQAWNLEVESENFSVWCGFCSKSYRLR